MNKVILCGRLTKDAELRYSPNGVALFKTSLAVDDGHGDKRKTDFFNLVSFGKLAETMAQYTRKGTKILITGKVKNNNFEKDGVKQYYTDIIIEELELLDKKPIDEANNIELNADLPF
jgi:single-strand DNA-binding protein